MTEKTIDPGSGTGTASRTARIGRRLNAARPPLAELLLGSLLWGVLMTVSALLGLYLRNRLETSHLQGLTLLYFSGGLLAWLFALPVARALAHDRSMETRFAAFFLVLTCFTIAMTAFLFAMEYRIFYSQWHQPFGTKIWVYQFLFTGASAAYQFAVLGIRLYLPLGFVFLVAASLYLARRMR